MSKSPITQGLTVTLLLCTIFFTTAYRPAPQPKIQAAILLDVSGSMNGLIDQAKQQLWNMVSVMGRAECYGVTPKIEIALYEYGRDNNDAAKGYVKQISPFTTDLDSLSQSLFALTTNGGSEYCGEVIYQSLESLKWDSDTGSYKVIFIAGNEDFLQGTRTYTEACALARKKGVIVNTIYCGPRESGIREHWNLGGECGQGSFTHINSNAKEIEIPTPFDSMLYVLNDQLNETYIAYGNMGEAGIRKQRSADVSNFRSNKMAMAMRVSVKAEKAYSNAEWDMVDRYRLDSTKVFTYDRAQVPDSLKNKTDAQIHALLAAKNREREDIKLSIKSVAAQRELWLQVEKTPMDKSGEPTLQTEIEKIIRVQALRHRMLIR